ncbi:hypothetical protein Nepgr_012788 [Nepenthes gracilis]|uniref:C3H1-type domain-containing protein n=1 Tax=Nepenthes gracilis TaxID=150966 RepID=A0AAD3XN37_NEPGR|nr:hypothetical protein Nepgr_012788 [Nepenthes gracilis]
MNTDDSIDQASQPCAAPNQPPSLEDQARKRKREDGCDEEVAESRSQLDTKSSHHSLHKTSLCSYFRRQSGCCSHGESCRFAHSEDELRPRPDGTWDPTSERAKKLCAEKEGEMEEERSVLMTEVLDQSGDTQLSKCLVHLPRKWSSDQLRNFLDEQGVLFKSAKKKKGMTVGFVNFETHEQMKNAIEVLEGRSIGNKTVKIADVIPRCYDDKIKAAQNRQQPIEPEAGCEEVVLLSSNDFDNGDKVDGSATKPRSARDVVTPLAHIPYEEQLERKKNSLMQILKRLTRNARKACPNGILFPEWIVKSREIGGLPCKLEGIIDSPLVNGYRNKCEFSVGYSVHGKPTVGFMLGNFREGVTAVEEPVDCPNVSKIACKYASVFQEFLQHSALPIWNRFNNTGFWRQLTVREGRYPQKEPDVESPETDISEVMLMVQICSVGSDDDLVHSELNKMSEAFAAGAISNSPPLPLTALVIQDHKGMSNAAPADTPLFTLQIPTVQNNSSAEALSTGEAWIHDYISNLQFCISPTAFFQVNTLAAEKLYSLAGNWAGLGPDTLLFDICCGTGTIGLTLAHCVGMVVGIEMNASAVSDAQRNAEINGIKNCRFVCAKAEDVMDALLKEYLNEHLQQDEASKLSGGDEAKITFPEIGPDTEEHLNKEVAKGGDVSLSAEKGQELQIFKNVVAIVDPPRGGLHPSVIKALRTNAWLRRLVYISCNPETLVGNAIELCTPSTDDKTEKGSKRNQGWRNMGNAALARRRAKSMPVSEPFQPVKAMAVDLFPHTPHCEMVMLLER